VINVLKHAKSCFAGVPLHAVVGGLHLSGSNERIIPETVKAMAEFNPAIIAAGHCTGWRAMTALANAFGDQRLVPLAVGKRYSFQSDGVQVIQPIERSAPQSGRRDSNFTIPRF